MKKSKPKSILKVISLALLFSFVVQDLSFAAQEIKAVDLLPKHSVLEFPASVATVKEEWRANRYPEQGSGAGSQKNEVFIYLIEDAHANPSAQINISKTIDLILQKEPLKYVFLEAGTGDDSLSSLRPLASLKKRELVAKSYLMKGLVQGPDYLDLTSGREFQLWGVEDEELYFRGLKIYKELKDKRDKSNSALDKIDRTVKTLKPRFFNPGLKTLDQKRTLFVKNELPLADYLDTLIAEAKRFGISPESFPSLAILKDIREKEKEIDFKKANEEQALTIGALSKEDQEELAVDSEKKSDGFYSLLEGKLLSSQESVVRSQEKQNLIKYFSYLKLSRKLEAVKVLKDKDDLETIVFSKLAKSEDEKRLLRISHSLEIIRNLLNLKLTTDEYLAITRSPKDFDIAEINGYLNRKIMDLRSYYEDALFLEPVLKKSFRSAREFYDLTLERNKAFVQNMLLKMSETGQTKAVLVTGGFHTPDLTKLLRERNISYLLITPQVLHETNQEKYETILLNQPSKKGSSDKNSGAITDNRNLKPTPLIAASKINVSLWAPKPAAELAQNGLGGSRLSVFDALRRDLVEAGQAEAGSVLKEDSSGVRMAGSTALMKQPLLPVLPVLPVRLSWVGQIRILVDYTRFQYKRFLSHDVELGDGWAFYELFSVDSKKPGEAYEISEKLHLLGTVFRNDELKVSQLNAWAERYGLNRFLKFQNGPSGSPVIEVIEIPSMRVHYYNKDINLKKDNVWSFREFVDFINHFMGQLSFNPVISRLLSRVDQITFMACATLAEIEKALDKASDKRKKTGAESKALEGKNKEGARMAVYEKENYRVEIGEDVYYRQPGILRVAIKKRQANGSFSKKGLVIRIPEPQGMPPFGISREQLAEDVWNVVNRRGAQSLKVVYGKPPLFWLSGTEGARLSIDRRSFLTLFMGAVLWLAIGPFAAAQSSWSYRVFDQKFAETKKVGKSGIGRSLSYLSPRGKLMPRWWRRIFAFGTSEVAFFGDSPAAPKMHEFLEALRTEFGDILLAHEDDNLHLTIQNLNNLARHSGMDSMDIRKNPYPATLARARGIKSEPFSVRVIGVSFRAPGLIYFQLEPIDKDVFSERRAAWRLKSNFWAPHVSAGLIFKPVPKRRFKELSDFIKEWNEKYYDPKDKDKEENTIYIDGTSIVAYEDHSFINHRVIAHIPFQRSLIPAGVVVPQGARMAESEAVELHSGIADENFYQVLLPTERSEFMPWKSLGQAIYGRFEMEFTESELKYRNFTRWASLARQNSEDSKGLFHPWDFAMVEGTLEPKQIIEHLSSNRLFVSRGREQEHDLGIHVLAFLFSHAQVIQRVQARLHVLGSFIRSDFARQNSEINEIIHDYSYFTADQIEDSTTALTEALAKRSFTGYFHALYSFSSAGRKDAMNPLEYISKEYKGSWKNPVRYIWRHLRFEWETREIKKEIKARKGNSAMFSAKEIEAFTAAVFNNLFGSDIGRTVLKDYSAMDAPDYSDKFRFAQAMILLQDREATPYLEEISKDYTTDPYEINYISAEYIARVVLEKIYKAGARMARDSEAQLTKTIVSVIKRKTIHIQREIVTPDNIEALREELVKLKSAAYDGNEDAARVFFRSRFNIEHANKMIFISARDDDGNLVGLNLALSADQLKEAWPDIHQKLKYYAEGSGFSFPGKGLYVRLRAVRPDIQSLNLGKLLRTKLWEEATALGYDYVIGDTKLMVDPSSQTYKSTSPEGATIVGSEYRESTQGYTEVYFLGLDKKSASIERFFVGDALVSVYPAGFDVIRNKEVYRYQRREGVHPRALILYDSGALKVDAVLAMKNDIFFEQSEKPALGARMTAGLVSDDKAEEDESAAVWRERRDGNWRAARRRHPLKNDFFKLIEEARRQSIEIPAMLSHWDSIAVLFARGEIELTGDIVAVYGLRKNEKAEQTVLAGYMERSIAELYFDKRNSEVYSTKPENTEAERFIGADGRAELKHWKPKVSGLEGSVPGKSLAFLYASTDRYASLDEKFWQAVTAAALAKWGIQTNELNKVRSRLVFKVRRWDSRQTEIFEFGPDELRKIRPLDIVVLEFQGARMAETEFPNPPSFMLYERGAERYPGADEILRSLQEISEMSIEENGRVDNLAPPDEVISMAKEFLEAFKTAKKVKMENTFRNARRLVRIFSLARKLRQIADKTYYSDFFVVDYPDYLSKRAEALVPELYGKIIKNEKYTELNDEFHRVVQMAELLAYLHFIEANPRKGKRGIYPEFIVRRAGKYRAYLLNYQGINGLKDLEEAKELVWWAKAIELLNKYALQPGDYQQLAEIYFDSLLKFPDDLLLYSSAVTLAKTMGLADDLGIISRNSFSSNEIAEQIKFLNRRLAELSEQLKRSGISADSLVPIGLINFNVKIGKLIEIRNLLNSQRMRTALKEGIFSEYPALESFVKEHFPKDRFISGKYHQFEPERAEHEHLMISRDAVVESLQEKFSQKRQFHIFYDYETLERIIPSITSFGFRKLSQGYAVGPDEITIYFREIGKKRMFEPRIVSADNFWNFIGGMYEHFYTPREKDLESFGHARLWHDFRDHIFNHGDGARLALSTQKDINVDYERLKEMMIAELAKILEAAKRMGIEIPATRKHLEALRKLFEDKKLIFRNEWIDVYSNDERYLGPLNRTLAHFYYGDDGNIYLDRKEVPKRVEAKQFLHYVVLILVRRGAELEVVETYSFHRKRKPAGTIGGHIAAGASVDETASNETVEEGAFGVDLETGKPGPEPYKLESQPVLITSGLRSRQFDQGKQEISYVMDYPATQKEWLERKQYAKFLDRKRKELGNEGIKAFLFKLRNEHPGYGEVAKAHFVSIPELLRDPKAYERKTGVSFDDDFIEIMLDEKVQDYFKKPKVILLDSSVIARDKDSIGTRMDLVTSKDIRSLMERGYFVRNFSGEEEFGRTFEALRKLKGFKKIKKNDIFIVHDSRNLVKAARAFGFRANRFTGTEDLITNLSFQNGARLAKASDFRRARARVWKQEILPLVKGVPLANMHQHAGGSMRIRTLRRLYAREVNREARLRFKKQNNGKFPTKQNLKKITRIGYKHRTDQESYRDSTEFDRASRPMVIALEKDPDGELHRLLGHDLVRFSKTGLVGLRATFSAGHRTPEEFAAVAEAFIVGIVEAERKSKSHTKAAVFLSIKNSASALEALTLVDRWIALRDRMAERGPEYSEKFYGIDLTGISNTLIDDKGFGKLLKKIHKAGFAVSVHIGEVWEPGSLLQALERTKKIVENPYVTYVTNPNVLWVKPNLGKMSSYYTSDEIRRISELQKEIFEIVRFRAEQNPVILELSPSANTARTFSLRRMEGWDFFAMAEILAQARWVVVTDDTATVFHTNLLRELRRLFLGDTVFGWVDKEDILQLVRNNEKLISLYSEKITPAVPLTFLEGARLAQEKAVAFINEISAGSVEAAEKFKEVMLGLGIYPKAAEHVVNYLRNNTIDFLDDLREQDIPNIKGGIVFAGERLKGISMILSGATESAPSPLLDTAVLMNGSGSGAVLLETNKVEAITIAPALERVPAAAPVIVNSLEKTVPMPDDKLAQLKIKLNKFLELQFTNNELGDQEIGEVRLTVEEIRTLLKTDTWEMATAYLLAVPKSDERLSEMIIERLNEEISRKKISGGSESLLEILLMVDRSTSEILRKKTQQFYRNIPLLRLIVDRFRGIVKKEEQIYIEEEDDADANIFYRSRFVNSMLLQTFGRAYRLPENGLNLVPQIVIESKVGHEPIKTEKTIPAGNDEAREIKIEMDGKSDNKLGSPKKQEVLRKLVFGPRQKIREEDASALGVYIQKNYGEYFEFSLDDFDRADEAGKERLANRLIEAIRQKKPVSLNLEVSFVDDRPNLDKVMVEYPLILKNLKIFSFKIAEIFSSESPEKLAEAMNHAILSAFVHGNAGNFNNPLYVYLSLDLENKTKETKVFSLHSKKPMVFSTKAVAAKVFFGGSWDKMVSGQFSESILDETGKILGNEHIFPAKPAVNDARTGLVEFIAAPEAPKGLIVYQPLSEVSAVPGANEDVETSEDLAVKQIAGKIENLRVQKDWSLVVESIADGFRRFPGHRYLRFELGMIYFDLQKWDSAVKIFKKLSEEYPSYPQYKDMTDQAINKNEEELRLIADLAKAASGARFARFKEFITGIGIVNAQPILDKLPIYLGGDSASIFRLVQSGRKILAVPVNPNALEPMVFVRDVKNSRLTDEQIISLEEHLGGAVSKSLDGISYSENKPMVVAFPVDIIHAYSSEDTFNKKIAEVIKAFRKNYPPNALLYFISQSGDPKDQARAEKAAQSPEAMKSAAQIFSGNLPLELTSRIKKGDALLLNIVGVNRIGPENKSIVMPELGRVLPVMRLSEDEVFAADAVMRIGKGVLGVQEDNINDLRDAMRILGLDIPAGTLWNLINKKVSIQVLIRYALQPLVSLSKKISEQVLTIQESSQSA